MVQEETSFMLVRVKCIYFHLTTWKTNNHGTLDKRLVVTVEQSLHSFCLLCPWESSLSSGSSFPCWANENNNNDEKSQMNVEQFNN